MTAWAPVLDGALADEAYRAVRDIALDMPAEIEPDVSRDVALWWAYAVERVGVDIADVRYDAATVALVRHIEESRHEAALHGGLAGAGWVLAHITDGGAEDVLAVVDAALLDEIASDVRRSDLVGGVAGVGVYFLERLEAAPALARRGLERVVAQLDALAIRDADGVAWPSPDGGLDCGASHGAPGTLAVLGRIAALSDPPPGAADLCARGIRWMAARRRPDPDAWFPASVVDGQPVGRPRNAWCYGDPGVAIALWNAAARIGAPTAEWIDVARAAASRPPGACDVEVPGLCHGALGLAHVFNRGFQVSGDPGLRDAARRWFAHGLALRRPAQGIAGFVAQRRRGGEITWVGSTDFIEGAAGIGLALLAGLGGDEPGWDRMLACDVPTGCAVAGPGTSPASR